jgi:hypothetical protein
VRVGPGVSPASRWAWATPWPRGNHRKKEKKKKAFKSNRSLDQSQLISLKFQKTNHKNNYKWHKTQIKSTNKTPKRNTNLSKLSNTTRGLKSQLSKGSKHNFTQVKQQKYPDPKSLFTIREAG